MMEENPSWWSMHSNLRSSTSNDHQQQSSGVSSNMLLSQTHPSLMPTIHYPHDHHQGQHFPNSSSQLLLGGLARGEEEERYGLNLFQTTKGMSKINLDDDNVKQDQEACTTNQQNNLIGYHHHYEELEVGVDNRGIGWSQNMPTSSPKSSCVTSLSSNTNDNSNDNTMLDFSTSKRSLHEDSQQHVDHSNSECNSTSDDLAEGVSNKKTKVQSLSTPFLKVRKEKLGDRITSLHQLVSPFGKTDTASVLLEAIGYIRFLQGQIEALASPYLGNVNASAKSQHPIHGERNCLFPDHPQQEYKDKDLDLKSRGLCLLPLSCTHIVGSDNGAYYWATPTLGREF